MHPTDDNLGGEVGVGDDVIRVRLFQANGTVSGSGVGAVVGIYGVVGGVDDAVSGMTLKLSDVPDSSGSNGEISNRYG